MTRLLAALALLTLTGCSDLADAPHWWRNWVAPDQMHRQG